MYKSRLVKMPKVAPNEERTPGDFDVKVTEITTIEKLYEYRTEKFLEKTPTVTNENEYSRAPGQDQGLVLIFNQVKFNGSHPERVGSNQDVNNIVDTLSKLGYNINVKEHVFTDYDRNLILAKQKALIEEHTTKSNCLIVIFLSHGYNNDTLYASTGSLTVKEIVNDFSYWKLFENLPKLFIFQACKGESEDIKPGNKHFTVSTVLPPDVVVYFSSVEDKVSHRNPLKGTWLIEEMCKMLLMYGKKEDVLSVLHRTNKCVATLANGPEKDSAQTTEVPAQPTKQMPVIISTLNKKFFLTTSKEKINYDAMVGDIEQLKHEIDKLQQLMGVLM